MALGACVHEQHHTIIRHTFLKVAERFKLVKDGFFLDLVVSLQWGRGGSQLGLASLQAWHSLDGQCRRS